MMTRSITRVVLVATAGAVLAWAARAAEPQPAQNAVDYVNVRLQGACDERNQHLMLANKHTFKTIAVTVRWRAAGGKDLVQQFYPIPNSITEIGCAASGEIVEAVFADF